MSKQKFEMNNLVAIQVITDDSTMDETYGVSMQIAAAEEEVKGKYGSVWSRLRYEVAKMCTEQLKLEGGDITKVDYKDVAAKFVTSCEGTEQRMDASAKKRPAAWVNAKSQLKLGLEEGFPFLKHPEVAQNKLRDAAKKLKDDREEAERVARLQKDAKKHGIQDVSKEKPDESDAGKGGEAKGGDAGDLPAGVDGKPDGKGKPATGSSTTETGKVVVKTPDREFKDPVLAAAVAKFIEAMMDLEATEGKNRREKTGGEVALSTVSSATKTLEDSLDAFQLTQAKLAAAS